MNRGDTKIFTTTEDTEDHRDFWFEFVKVVTVLEMERFWFRKFRTPEFFSGAYGSEVVCDVFLMRWILVLLFEVLGRIGTLVKMRFRKGMKTSTNMCSPNEK